MARLIDKRKLPADNVIAMLFGQLMHELYGDWGPDLPKEEAFRRLDLFCDGWGEGPSSTYLKRVMSR